MTYDIFIGHVYILRDNLSLNHTLLLILVLIDIIHMISRGLIVKYSVTLRLVC